MTTVSTAAPSQVVSRPPVVVRPAVILQWALLLLVVGNIGRIPLLDLGERAAPLLINDLCLAIVLVTGAVALLNARSLRLDSVALAALVFAAIGGLSAVAAVPRFELSGIELLGSLAYLARWCVYFALYLVVINCVRAWDLERIWTAAESALLVIAAFGIIQVFFLPNFAFIVYPDAREILDWDPQGHRLVSTVLEPNVAAAMLVIGLLMQLARLACGVRVAIWKPALLFAALVLTLSRSGALAFMTGVLLLLVARGLSKRVMKFGALVALLLLVSLPRLITFGAEYSRFGITDGSARARVETWARAIATFLENPWFGIGFNTYGFVQERRGYERLGTASYSAEGGLLFIAVMTGLVGLAVYSVMLWLVYRRCRAGWRHPASTPHERGLFIGTAAATTAILIHSVFVNSLLMPFVMELLWILWGMVLVATLHRGSRATMAVTRTSG